MLRETSFRPSSGHPERPNHFVIPQTASRIYLSELLVTPSIPGGRGGGGLPPASSASSLTFPTREARYARAESALRVALSRCESEPSPLELQVRVLEKGLQAWNARAGRGYERVQEAEEALAAAAAGQSGEGPLVRGSFSELQREKWMGMKERDEALAMIERIKGLIKELNTDIMVGRKASPTPVDVHCVSPKAGDGAEEEALSRDTASKKAAILFSGKLPMPYLENLPRSRRSVEPLRLPLQITNLDSRRRSSTLHSEATSSIESSTSSTTAPPTPLPATPTDDFGSAYIQIPLPSKSVAQYLAELEETRETVRVRDHMKLPSYVDALLDELGEDRIRDENLQIAEISRSSTRCSSASSTPPSSSLLPNRPMRSKGLLRRFSNLPSVPSLSRPASQLFRSKENHDPSTSLHEHSVDSPTIPERGRHTLTCTTTGTSPSGSLLTSPTLDTSSRKHRIKSPRRIGKLMESVKRGVKKVSGRGE